MAVTISSADKALKSYYLEVVADHIDTQKVQEISSQ